jgi:hypothetical protein
VRLEFPLDRAHRREDVLDHLPAIRGQRADVRSLAGIGDVIVLGELLDQPIEQGHLFVRREVDDQGCEVRGVPPRCLGRIQHPRNAQDHVLDQEILDQSERLGAVAVEERD